jgi:phosphoglucosamine mutase
MTRLFGTDGVRGIANKELTPDLAYRLGVAACCELASITKAPLFVIGKDTRISGDMLESALSAGIMSAGGSVVSLGIIPTPAYLF